MLKLNVRVIEKAGNENSHIKSLLIDSDELDTPSKGLEYLVVMNDDKQRRR